MSHLALPNTHLDIFNDATESVVTSLELKAPVQRVRISKTHLVVVQDRTVLIYKMEIPLEKVVAYETADNPLGLCCLGKNLVIFPGLTSGQVRLYNLNTNDVSIIPAHNSPLRAIVLSHDEEMVATASEQGTLVRLFSLPSTTKVTEFRRGVDPAAILSLAFSPDLRFLAATSDKSTLHIFDLVQGAVPEPDSKTHKWGILSKLPMLPRQFSDIYASATIKFELGDEPIPSAVSKSSTLPDEIYDGIPGGTPNKGLIGWLDDYRLVIVGAGHDARWEKFLVSTDEAGARVIVREGWKRYLD
jgi:WD40 repeat protein